MNTESKFSAKEPGFNDIKQVVISDVVDLWRKGSLAVIRGRRETDSRQRVSGAKSPELDSAE